MAGPASPKKGYAAASLATRLRFLSSQGYAEVNAEVNAEAGDFSPRFPPKPPPISPDFPRNPPDFPPSNLLFIIFYFLFDIC
jgi:hypothetical protein